MNTVLSEIRDAFTTTLSGEVDSVMFSYQDLISRWAGIVSSPGIFSFYFFVLLCQTYLEHFFHYTFFSGLLNGCLIGRLYDRKPKQMLLMF